MGVTEAERKMRMERRRDRERKILTLGEGRNNEGLKMRVT